MSQQQQPAGGAAEGPQTDGDRESALGHAVEVETGPLLPRWLTTLLYVVLIPWCIVSLGWLGWRMHVQGQVWSALDLVGGPWEGPTPSMDSPVVGAAVGILQGNPRDSLREIIQELRQDERKDSRMVRAIVLSKAVRWDVESRRRQLFDELLDNMLSSGIMRRDYKLPAQHEAMLAELLGERRANPTTSYEENKITDVLEWLERGRPTIAVGPERRRIKSLKIKYDKKLFFSSEADALRQIQEEWLESGDPVKQGAAEKFAEMLEDQHAKLTPQEQEFCLTRARHWEGLYREGRERLAWVCEDLAGRVAKGDIWLDHSEIWDLASLLDVPGETARGHIAKAVLAMRARKFALVYLGEFVETDTVNHVMAIETARLSGPEHEALVREEMRRRRLGALDVLHQIVLQYCRRPFPIEEVPPDEQEEFFKENVVRSLQHVREDKDVGERAGQILDDIEKLRRDYLQ